MKLRAYRSIVNLTQKQMARRLGVTELSVIKYEAGTNIPSRDVMLRIYEETRGAVAPNDFYELKRFGHVYLGGSMESDRETLVAVGLMSGTSMDGIDACLISTEGEALIKELAATSLAYDSRFRVLMKAGELAVNEARGDLVVAEEVYGRALTQYLTSSGIIAEKISGEKLSLSTYLYGESKEITLSDVIRHSTELHSQIVESLLKASGFSAREVDLIGYHGQTLYHRPADGITIQAGDPKYLAELTGIAVVGDFRSNDVKNGGQGAPFAPLYHAALARQSSLAPVVIANCGGIGNITVVTRNDADLFAFDTGPGNALLDRYVFAKLGRSCDLDGALAKQGEVNEAVMAALRKGSVLLPGGRNYLDHSPPKSLDINDLKLVPELETLSIFDACATLTAFTAECMVDSLRWIEEKQIEVPRLWIVAGGGWENPAILKSLEEKLIKRLGSDVRVQKAETVGWNGAALEAQIFAYLAVRSLKGLPLSTPGTTGVSEAVTGGTLALPAGKRASARIKGFLGESKIM
jgi:anhydro-N-acetylmuramic acid kinase